MSAPGTVEAIFICPDAGEPMQAVESVEAVAGRGLRGDRYFRGRGIYDEHDHLPEGADVTLIEAEVLEAVRRDADVDLEPRETRRNVLTRGVALHHLVGQEFAVGEAVLEGDGLCEPCSYMENLAGKAGAEDALVHRGGLNATVVETGPLAVGHPIEY